MNAKKAGWLFFIIVVTHVAIIAGLSAYPRLLTNMSGAVNLLLGQLILIVPTLIFTGILSITGKYSYTEGLCIRKIKPGSVFMLILSAFLIIPLATLINLFSMFFTTNVVNESSDIILQYPWYMVLLFVGILGPICEELVFRGVIFQGMKRSISVFLSVVLSSLFFGLMHMNINQALYAVVLGIFMAIAVEATDSVVGSMIIHMTINSEQMLMLIIVSHFIPDFYKTNSLDTMPKEQIYISCCVYMILALICTTLAICSLVWIAGHEGQKNSLKMVVSFKNEAKVTPKVPFREVLPLQSILAIVICIIYMVVFC